MENIIDRFSTTQAAALSELGYDTVDYWATTGFLKPSIADSEGTRRRRKYSFVDVLALRIAAEMRQTGLSLQSLRRAVHYLREHGAEEPPLATSFLVFDEVDVYLCQGEELHSVLRKPGQGSFRFVVDLGRAERELNDKVRELFAA